MWFFVNLCVCMYVRVCVLLLLVGNGEVAFWLCTSVSNHRRRLRFRQMAVWRSKQLSNPVWHESPRHARIHMHVQLARTDARIDENLWEGNDEGEGGRRKKMKLWREGLGGSGCTGRLQLLRASFNIVIKGQLLCCAETATSFHQRRISPRFSKRFMWKGLMFSPSSRFVLKNRRLNCRIG